MRGSRIKSHVWRAQRTFHIISCVIFMRSCYVFDSPRLSLPHLAVHFLSYRLVHLPSLQFLLPRCGGQIPCALPLMRTLAPLPSTTLSHNLDSYIQIKYIDTKHQLADILTKGNFTRDEWNNLYPAAQRIPA